MRREIRVQIRKLNNNEKIRWEEQFPSTYGEKKFTANNRRNINMATKELQKFPLRDIRKEAQKMGLMYVISQNSHTGKWGLDKESTHEGGGVIAQSNTYLECVKRAHLEFGINPIFINGVGLHGW